MKYSFALAALLAVASVESVAAIQMTAEPVMKKEAPKKTAEEEAAIQAKFDAKKAEVEERKDKAVAKETADMEAAEAKSDEEKKAYQTQYWKNIGDMSAETKRIQDLRVRPKESNPMEGHDKEGTASAGEHWTHNMPDHILDNKKGPSAPFDSPAPVAGPGAADAAAADASSDEAAADAKKKTEAKAAGAKAAAAATAPEK